MIPQKEFSFLFKYVDDFQVIQERDDEIILKIVNNIPEEAIERIERIIGKAEIKIKKSK